MNFFFNSFVLLAIVSIASADYHTIVETSGRTYEEAQQACLKKNHTLVTVSSAEKNEIVRKQMQEAKLTNIWIDVTRKEHDTDEKPWKWEHASNWYMRVKEFFWAAGEPNNQFNMSERCVEMIVGEAFSAGKDWNDLNCNRTIPFICDSSNSGDVNLKDRQ